MVVRRESKTIMADIISFGLDAAAGGVFGIIGTTLGRVAGFFERRDENAKEQASWGHEYRLHELNMKARAQESEIEIELAS